MDRSAIFEQAVPIVEALIGSKKTKSLVDSLGPNEYLAVDASVKVRGHRTTESKEHMQNLANELADLTDGKVQVFLDCVGDGFEQAIVDVGSAG